MKPLMTVCISHSKNAGCRSVATDERIMGITYREVKIFGLKVLSVAKTTFVTEVRLFNLTIKRTQQKGWVLYYYR